MTILYIKKNVYITSGGLADAGLIWFLSLIFNDFFIRQKAVLFTVFTHNKRVQPRMQGKFEGEKTSFF